MTIGVYTDGRKIRRLRRCRSHIPRPSKMTPEAFYTRVCIYIAVSFFPSAHEDLIRHDTRYVFNLTSEFMWHIRIDAQGTFL